MRLASEHFPLLILLVVLMSAFAALLWKDDARDARRFFLRATLGLVGTAVALGYLFSVIAR